MKRGLVLALATGLVAPWTSLADAQTSVTGGIQNLGAWPESCGTTRSFTNNTGLVLGGLWVAINNDGTINLPEIGTVSVDNVALTLNWDVDDSEDLTNTGDVDEFDTTPTSSSGWHRAQARLNADRIAVGATFTVKLCDSVGNPLGGRNVHIVPMAPFPGQVGGDLTRRTQVPFNVSSSSTLGSVTIDSTGAPPVSDDFAVAVTNTDPTLYLKRLKILLPPGGISIDDASASGGGTYDPPTSTIIWATPIAPSLRFQVNVGLNMLVRTMTPNTIQFQATEFVDLTPPGVPALPSWAIASAALGVALVGAWLVRKNLA